MDKTNPEINNYSNFIKYFDKYEGKATAYVCINKTCKAPTNDIRVAIENLLITSQKTME